MNNLLPSFRRGLRRVSGLLLPPVLVLLALAVLASQFREVATRNEILSLTSFVVLVSFAALAFNWSRAGATPPAVQVRIYEAGVDLFIAAILALVATFFSWLQSTPGFGTPTSALILFVIHWIFLALSVLLSLVALLTVLSTVKESGNSTGVPK